VTGVDTSDGELDTVNGDFTWGSDPDIEVSRTGYRTPQAFADDAEGSGENWIFVAPKLSGGTTVAGEFAGPGVALNPSTGDQDVVFQGGNGDIYEYHYNDAKGTWSGVDECSANSWGCSVS
jgi:hypothetical protein